MANKISRLENIRERVRAFWDESVLSSQTELSAVEKFLHFWLLVWRSFVRNRCPAHASAMAYGTLLALIPLLAVVMSITSSFLKKEGEERIDQFIVKMVESVSGAAGQVDAARGPTHDLPLSQPSTPPETVNHQLSPPSTAPLSAFAQEEQAVKARKEIAHYINQFIQNTRSGTLGATGSVLLIFVAISLLSRIEDTFNDIWGVARGRGWFMRVVLYWGVIALVPLLVVMAVGLATGPHLALTRRLLTPFLSHFTFHFLPVVLLCLAFALFYMLMPNTKVAFRAALVGGVVGGLLWHLNNLVSVIYVSRVVSNSKIYGSLGLIPVFMIGLYFSWLILLFGAQVAYAFQNRAAYLEEKQLEHINQRGREFVALRLMALIGQRFLLGDTPPNVADIGGQLSVPTRLIQQILQTLCAARLVVEAAGADPAYVPARPLESITCHDILLALRAGQGQELATRDEPARAEVYGEFQRIQEAERQAAASVTMLALASRAAGKQLAA